MSRHRNEFGELPRAERQFERAASRGAVPDWRRDVHERSECSVRSATLSELGKASSLGLMGRANRPAIETAVARAAETLEHLDWFVVKEIRGNIEDGKAKWYQVSLDVGFRVMDPAGGRD